jgi:hypothetical protein
MNNSQLAFEIGVLHEKVIAFGRKEVIEALNELLQIAKERGLEVRL